MADMITAIYEKGALHPLEPLNLRERQKVRIQVITEEPAEEIETQERPEVAESSEAERVKAVIQRLIAKGWMHPKPKGPIPPDPVSAEERQRLADLMGNAPGKPLSEIIIEERGEQ